MGKRLRVPLIVGLGLLAALFAAATLSSAAVSFRSAERDGARVAEVLIGDRVVIVLRTSAGGYTPLERAEIVANRLRSALSEEVAAEDVQARPILSGHGVFAANRLIVAVYESEAAAHEASPESLAKLWRDNVLLALSLPLPEEASEEEPPVEETPGSGEAAAPGSGEAPAPGAAEQPEGPVSTGQAAAPEAATAAEPTALDWMGTAQKWVPIFSLEREGVRIGFAQVAGPTSQVEKVKGVAQLRLDFQRIGRIYAYIPVSTISVTKLDRVQGVSVWALADVKVLNF